MAGSVWQETSEEFQDRVCELLRRRYINHDFCEIPDRHGGDRGLEGFSRDGCAYQCYAAEEPLTPDELYEKQRDKITRDIGKFVTNSADLQSIFHPTVIKRWILVVPRHESAKLLIHAGTKAGEVRDHNLPYVACDFTIHIETLEYFAVEAAQLLGAVRTQLRMDLETVTSTEIDSWQSQNNSLTNTLIGKLEKLPSYRCHNTAKQQQQVAGLIKQFLVGQNLLHKLLIQYPEVYKKVGRAKSDQENLLEAASLQTTTGQAHFQAQLASLSSSLTPILVGFDKNHVEQLVYESVTDWLVRCPLDFPEVV
jgi:hypothetical protein